MNRTGSNLLRSSSLFVACFFLALSAVSGQEVDVAVRSVDGASPAVAVDYASIIRFSTSREVAERDVENRAILTCRVALERKLETQDFSCLGFTDLSARRKSLDLELFRNRPMTAFFLGYV